MEEKSSFMDGTKIIVIISDACSTGVSLHVDKHVVNQRRRVHITMKFLWGVDHSIQQLRRTHCSNQSFASQYHLFITNLGGERWVASTIARHVDSKCPHLG